MCSTSSVKIVTGAKFFEHGSVATAELADSAVTPLKIQPLQFQINGGSYTLVLADRGKVVEQAVGSANNVTVPPNSSVAFPIGTEILIAQISAGQVTIVAGAGVTLRSSPGLKIAAIYGIASLIKRGTDEWYVSGNLTA